MEFNPLPDSLNTGFTIIEIGYLTLVLWWRTHGSENMQIPDFFDRITSRWRVLVGTNSGMTTCENTSNIG